MLSDGTDQKPYPSYQDLLQIVSRADAELFRRYLAGEDLNGYVEIAEESWPEDSDGR